MIKKAINKIIQCAFNFMPHLLNTVAGKEISCKGNYPCNPTKGDKYWVKQNQPKGNITTTLLD